MQKTNKKVPMVPDLYPPVVAVLGHVDHGKTSLLDAIRKTNIVKREYGGITQSIGASQVEIVYENIKRSITFLDTPGHEAFSLIRTRGVKVADIGLLVISLVDGIMPQTKESIEILKISQIPFIVVLTKADLPEKNPEKIKQGLLKEGVLLEGYGGDVSFIEVSAKNNINIKELLDLILLVFDVKKALVKDFPSASKPLEAVVIESSFDHRTGSKATLVIKNGTLRLRDKLLCGDVKASVKSILNDRFERLEQISIGQAAEVLGFESMPLIGGVVVYANQQLPKETPLEMEVKPFVLDQDSLLALDENKKNKLIVIICADTQGSAEAILGQLPAQVKLVKLKIGTIEASDVLFAKSVGAIILGFNIKINPEIERLVTNERVLCKNYLLIYELIDEIKDFLEGKKSADAEKILGKAKVLASFPFEKTKALGIEITQGRLTKGARVRLMRGENIIGETTISSLRLGKDPVSKAEKGQQAGLVLSTLLDFSIGDVLICHG